MSKLKDICLQVRYEGKPSVLARDFYGPVSTAASIYRIRINSVSRDSLLPAAIGLCQILGSGKPVRFLLVIPSPETEPEFAMRETAFDDVTVQLKSLGIPATEQSHKNVDELASKFEFRIARPQAEAGATLEPAPRTLGFFSDEGGSSVAYETEDLPPPANGSVAPLSLMASWSWGDPQLKVNKSLEAFDKIWNSSAGKPPSWLASPNVAKLLLTSLLYIDENPEFFAQSDTAIRLFRHQKEAVTAWKAHDFRGVFKMCTGAGKTIGALAGVQHLSDDRTSRSLKLPPVIVSVPTRVLADQWIKEIKRFGFRSIVPAYNAFEQWSQLLEPTLRSQTGNQPRFVVTTYRTFADERFIAKLQRAGSLGIEALWIADEMHNLASSRLREAMRQTGSLFKFRLGLSATPEIEGDLTATEQLLDYFGGVQASYELRNGIEDGVLCPYRYHPHSNFADTAGDQARTQDSAEVYESIGTRSTTARRGCNSSASGDNENET